MEEKHVFSILIEKAILNKTLSNINYKSKLILYNKAFVPSVFFFYVF